MPATSGQPSCPRCNGTGHIVDGRFWRRCPCSRPTPPVTALIRRANQRDGRPFALPGAYARDDNADRKAGVGRYAQADDGGEHDQ